MKIEEAKEFLIDISYKLGNMSVEYLTEKDGEKMREAIKALEQEPSEDWCDVPSDEMTLEQARQAVKDLRKMLVEYLEQKPCEDAISRQAVLDQTYLWSKDEFLRVTNPFDYLRNRINSLPPVTPQPKRGHWIPTYGNVECSVCGSVKDSREVGRATHYCDFCGAKMVEPQESEEV